MRGSRLGLFRAMVAMVDKPLKRASKRARRRTPCWEFMACGRQPGGPMAKTLGVCPVAEADYYDGVNNGNAAGRVCWKMQRGDGEACDDTQFMTRLRTCMACEFFKCVRREEGDDFDMGL